MEHLIAIGFLVSGFAILLLGGESLVKAAVSIAARLKIRPAIVGLTIIAAGTSAPELLTSLMASIEGTPDVAVGNIIGSNVFNIFAILGIAGILSPILCEKQSFRFELPILVVFTVIFTALIFDADLVRWEGALFISLLTLFMYVSIRRALKSNDAHEEDLEMLKNPLFDTVYLLIGAAALIGGAELALEGGVKLGYLFGLSERVIGITIISVGTGLPELATSVVAALRKRNDIAFSNVIGSNLFNTFGVAGVAGAAVPIAINEALITDALIMLGVTLFMWGAIYFSKLKINRSLGIIFASSYIAYLFYLLAVIPK